MVMEASHMAWDSPQHWLVWWTFITILLIHKTALLKLKAVSIIHIISVRALNLLYFTCNLKVSVGGARKFSLKLSFKTTFTDCPKYWRQKGIEAIESSVKQTTNMPQQSPLQLYSICCYFQMATRYRMWLCTGKTRQFVGLTKQSCHNSPSLAVKPMIEKRSLPLATTSDSRFPLSCNATLVILYFKHISHQYLSSCSHGFPSGSTTKQPVLVLH